MSNDITTNAAYASTLNAGISLPSENDLNNMSSQQLRGELARSLTVSAHHLTYLAMIWRELERRGEDLRDLRIGLASYLPLIAAGQLDASAVIRFAGQPTMLRAISALPLQDQKEIAAGKPIRVLSMQSDGQYTSAEMQANELTAAQVRMVFDSGRIRDVEEQKNLLESSRVIASRRTRPGPEGKVRYDEKTDLLRIGRSSATIGEVVAALATAQGKSDDQHDVEVDFQVTFKLTEEELKMLKIRAAEAGLSQQEFLRKLVTATAIL